MTFAGWMRHIGTHHCTLSTVASAFTLPHDVKLLEISGVISSVVDFDRKRIRGLLSIHWVRRRQRGPATAD